MASVLDKKIIKNDKKCMYYLIAVVILCIWFLSSPTKRLAELGMTNNTIRFKYAQLTHQKFPEEYVFHRNNAVYLVKMNSPIRTKHAILEMDKSISTVPDYVPPQLVQGLYKDRAYIKLYAGDKKGALDDLLLSGNLNINDNLKAASLLTEKEVYGVARKHCQNILKENDNAISGYICMSYVYEKAGKPQSALKIYNYAIDKKKPNNPKLYVERALLKQRTNDFIGYNEDIAIAKNLSPNIDTKISMMEEVIHPTSINLIAQ